MAAQTVIRWSHHGVWERLLEQAQQRKGLKLGMAFLDGTTIRPSPVLSTRLRLAEPLASLAHQKAAGAARSRFSAQRDKREALGRSHGDFSTKVCLPAHASG